MKKLIAGITILALASIVWAAEKKQATADGANCKLTAKAEAAKCSLTAKAEGEQCALTAKADACCPSKKFQEVAFKVDGLACEASSGKLDTILTALTGVQGKSLCTQSHMAKIQFDQAKLPKQNLIAAIQKAGFKVEGQQVEYQVKGMTCGGCAKGLTQSLSKLNGVAKNEVCHKSGKTLVFFDPTKLSEKQIVAAIDNSGFKVDTGEVAEKADTEK